MLIGGATATLLRRKGTFQDINQIELMRPHVKRALRVSVLDQLVGTLEVTFQNALSGVSVPVFLEFSVDLLYPQDLIAKWYFD